MCMNSILDLAFKMPGAQQSKEVVVSPAKTTVIKPNRSKEPSCFVPAERLTERCPTIDGVLVAT